MDAYRFAALEINFAAKFPCHWIKIPVPRNNFPVNLHGELLD
jgi:hypothetical protein